jgi:hypothetical protein
MPKSPDGHNSAGRHLWLKTALTILAIWGFLGVMLMAE